jgi:hypothetical protein
MGADGGSAVLWSPDSLSGIFSLRHLRSQHLSVAVEQPVGGVLVSLHTTFTLGISLADLADRVERVLRGRLRFSASAVDLKRAFAGNV